MAKIYLKYNSEYIEISKAGSKIDGSWDKGEIISILQKHNGVWTTDVSLGGFSIPYAFGGYIPTMPDEIVSLSIEGASKVNSTSSEYVLLANGAETTGGTWSIISGGTYASISTGGTLTIDSSATGNSVTIQATLDDLAATKEVYVTYNAVTSSQTTTNTSVDESGNTTTTVTTVTDNGDGTTTSESTTITYNIEGEPVERINEKTDEEGVVSTQNIEYNDDGEEVVTGYEVDTSGNPQGYKNYNNDGVNTEYYALDATQGFIMNIHFTIDFTQQPPNQNDNHHNIVNSKRATPEPWYGFQIRQSSTNKYITLGTQFATGSNANTQITAAAANKLSTNVYEYNIRIVYDPLAASNNFVCDELIGGFNYTTSSVFPDIPDLEYIKTTVGCALDENGDPFRFSNIDVKAFSLEKLPKVAAPAISCDGQSVTMTCATTGATIYYRRNQSGTYTQYTTPISISADTIFEAYAELNGDRSKTTTETCLYDNGIATPVITCDGDTNDGNSASLYVNDTLIETVTITDNIATFTARTFTSGDTIKVTVQQLKIHLQFNILKGNDF